MENRCSPEEIRGIIGVDEEEIRAPEPAAAEHVAKVFSALSNPLRLQILYLVRDRWLPVCIISGKLGVEQSLVSHHLQVLRDRGLVVVERRRKYRLYRASHHPAAVLAIKMLEQGGRGSENPI